MRRHSAIMTRFALLTTLIGAAAGAPTVILAGGGCHADTGSVSTEGSATVIRMDVCDFAPTVSRVPVGTEVRFLNTDAVAHIVIGRRSTWASAELQPGADFVHRFDAAGTYPYMCSFHPGMVGAIVVGDAAQAAASEEPSLAAATTAGDAGGGPAAVLIVGAGALTLAAGLAIGLMLARRRTPSAAPVPGASLD